MRTSRAAVPSVIGLVLVVVGAAATASAAPRCPGVKTTTDAFCFAGDDVVLSGFDACGTTAVLCTSGDAGQDCAALDLAKGTFRRATVVAPAPHARVEQQGSVVRVCAGTRCVATDLPISETPYLVDASDDGKRVVVSVDALGNSVVVIDVASGKRARTVQLPVQASDQVGPAYFLGTELLVLIGQWPIERGVLVAPNDASRMLAGHVGRGKPFALGGTRWALSSYGGDVVTVLDTRSGAVTRSQPPGDHIPACHDCFTNADDPGVAASRLAMAGGRLVLVNVTGISLVDPRTLKTTRRFALPICKRPRP